MSLIYKCSSCSAETTISISYSRVIHNRNKEMLCRTCRLRNGVSKHQILHEINELGRKCINCTTWKQWDAFPGKGSTYKKKNGRCKDCLNNSFITKWGSDPEYKKRIQRTTRKSHLLRKYNITLEQYDTLVEEQNGYCKICQKLPPKLYVDHCHTTGAIRGLLCRSCNLGIGLFVDDPDILERAKEYINAS